MIRSKTKTNSLNSPAVPNNEDADTDDDADVETDDGGRDLPLLGRRLLNPRFP